MDAKRGIFITMEGGEGAGKSTQLRKLSACLTSHGVEHITTREPGGSDGAELIRQLIVTGEQNRWDAVTETLLIMSARYHHVTHTILPALESGKWVLCDRFYDSTRVYQGIAKGVDMDWLDTLYRQLFGNLTPDLTFYLDIEPAAGLKRAAVRAGNETRFEGMPVDFHEMLRTGFLALHESEPQRICKIAAEQGEDEVFEHICQIMTARFNLCRKDAA